MILTHSLFTNFFINRLGVFVLEIVIMIVLHYMEASRGTRTCI